MKQLKYFFQDKKKKQIFFLIAGFLILFLGVFLILMMIGKKYTYSDLENELYYATQKYLKDHSSYYPTLENPVTIISGNDLVNEKYIKDINKLVKDSCEAKIEVNYNNDAYQIKPFLICENYESKTFFDKILSDNPVVTSSNGLYDLNEMLVFRGDRVNNYATFHNKLWRIVKMDPVTQQVYLILDNLKDTSNEIWDNRYNTSEESRHGINDFSVSVIRYTLNDLYESTFSQAKSRMIPIHPCIGKRSVTEVLNDGSVECSYMMEETAFVSLLPIYDYINASTDHRCSTVEDMACSNYNYLLNKNGKWWTITGDGHKGTNVYGINYNGVITSDYADSKRYLRYIILVDGSNIYDKGNGTIDQPYEMK